MADRQKFQTCKIRLVGNQQLNAALARLQHVPIDPEKPLEVIIREEVKGRGLDANAYYWMRLTEIADQAWFCGKQYSKEVWHEYCRQNILPAKITTKDGEHRSKFVECPAGDPVIISTTQLERKCFAEYTEAVQAFGATLGVRFSADKGSEDA